MQHAVVPEYDVSNQVGSVHFYIAPSLIPGAGRGCFARHSFDTGEFLAEYLGLRLPVTSDSTYAFTLKNVAENTVLDAKHVVHNNPMRFVNGANHHRPEQLGLVNTSAREVRNGRVHYYATRNIAAGEELIVDYGRGYWLTRA